MEISYAQTHQQCMRKHWNPIANVCFQGYASMNVASSFPFCLFLIIANLVLKKMTSPSIVVL